jgi:SAM-dependent methyltransferase
MGDPLTLPSMARNREPILAVLLRFLPRTGVVLEIASGTGDHAAYFARALPDLTWQPRDPDPAALKSIAAHRAVTALPNLCSPLLMNASAPDWPVDRADAVVASNMVHIAPWCATLGLMVGAGRLLPPAGVLYFYGPFKENGGHTAPSNEAFDRDLRARDPGWGVRALEDIDDAARAQGLEFVERIAVPANNLSIVFRKDSAN